MAIKASRFGFVECADLISEQKYGPALRTFQVAVSDFLEAKMTPKRSEIARQLIQIGTALEETLKKAFGDKWETHVPKFSEEGKIVLCSFCGKNQQEVGKIIAGPSVHICDECVELCGKILRKQNVNEAEEAAAAATERLCGICMEQRESDELIFLPHAAYMCAACLEDIQALRDQQTGK